MKMSLNGAARNVWRQLIKTGALLMLLLVSVFANTHTPHTR